MAVLRIWSDLRCPWAYVATVRLHRMRDHLSADEVIFDHRAYPMELTEGGLHSEHTTRAEMVAAAQLESSVFSAYQNPTWPASYLAAFEAQKWGYSLSQEIGEEFDFALRKAFFLHGHNLSMRAELLEVARIQQLPVDQLAGALDDGRFRKAVMSDFHEATDLGIEGSPQVFLPDGTTHHNPGTTVRWERGLPIIEADHPSVYEELIQSSAVDW
ncbi:MAG TPA: DsbA family protein [Acidimicrobiia bacterium]|nr:DsbA family protein [Acidimicrobiia bacterium]